MAMASPQYLTKKPTAAGDEDTNPNDEQGEYANGLPNLTSATYSAAGAAENAAKGVGDGPLKEGSVWSKDTGNAGYPDPTQQTASASNPVMPSSGNTGVNRGQTQQTPQALPSTQTSAYTPTSSFLPGEPNPGGGQAGGYSTPQTGTSGGGQVNAQNYRGWIDNELNNVQSTDDRNYWYTQASKDPKFIAGDPSAVAWWKDAIQRGDGSALVKSGQLSKRAAPGEAPGQGASGAGAQYGGGAMGAAIARLLSRGESQIDPNAGNIGQATSAYRAQVENSTRRSRAALAERMAAEGLNNGGAGSGAFDSAIQSQQEQGGRDVANFQAQQVTQELMARRQDVVNALQFAQGEEKMALEQQLATMNQQLAMSQMNQQNQQFYDTMGYNIGRDTQNYNLDMYDRLAAGA